MWNAAEAKRTDCESRHNTSRAQYEPSPPASEIQKHHLNTQITPKVKIIIHINSFFYLYAHVNILLSILVYYYMFMYSLYKAYIHLYSIRK